MTQTTKNTTARTRHGEVDPPVSYGTPPEIISAARKTLGRIEVDLCSNAYFQQAIDADQYFTAPRMHIDSRPNYFEGRIKRVAYLESYGGLDMKYRSRLSGKRVFCNPPFQRGIKACGPDCRKVTCNKRGYHIGNDQPSTSDFVLYLFRLYMQNVISAAVIVTFNNVASPYGRAMQRVPKWVGGKRPNFLPDAGEEAGHGAPKDTAVCYLGSRVSAFAANFDNLRPWGGIVTFPYFATSRTIPLRPKAGNSRPHPDVPNLSYFNRFTITK